MREVNLRPTIRHDAVNVSPIEWLSIIARTLAVSVQQEPPGAVLPGTLPELIEYFDATLPMEFNLPSEADVPRIV